MSAVAGSEDVRVEEKAPSIGRATLCEKLTFTWVDPLLKAGSRGRESLESRDLAELPTRSTCAWMTERLKECWEYEVAASKARQQSSRGEGKTVVPDKSGMMMSRALFQAFLRDDMKTGIILIVDSGAKIVQALSVGWLVGYFADETAPAWHGWVFAAVICCAATTITLLHHQFFFGAWLLGMHLKTVTTGLLFDKLLRLRLAGLGSLTTGSVLNLATSDAEKFQLFGTFIHFVWVAPLETIIICILGVRVIGVSFLAGAAALCLLVPLQTMFSRAFAKYRAQVTELTDLRMKLTNQAVTGARLMKISAWEAAVADQILEVRKREVAALMKATRLRAINEAFFFCMPAVMALLVFPTYHALGNELTAEKIFTTLSLLSITQFTMGKFYPYLIQSSSESWVSIKRLENFMLLPETGVADICLSTGSYCWAIPCSQEPHHFPASLFCFSCNSSIGYSVGCLGSEGSSRIQLMGQSFRWDEKEQDDADASDVDNVDKGEQSSGDVEEQTPTTSLGLAKRNSNNSSRSSRHTLDSIHLEVPPGHLVVVIGEVGSAKSSLCLALLQEMVLVEDENMKPKETIDGSIAWSGQDSWVMSGTIRKNILFGRAFDQARYNNVVKACALIEDFRALPNGDLTIIGDRGVNLSGGQKARIGLCRMAYADANCYIMDDPLSAVDPAVGNRLFNRIIGNQGLLKGKTRLLVTHQAQFLSDKSIDRIIVMSHGRIAADGTYNELVGTPAMQSVLGGSGSVNEREQQQASVDRDRSMSSFASREKGVTENGAAEKGKEGQLTIVEDQEIGEVAMSTYASYAKAATGLPGAVLLGLLLALGQVVLIMSSVWLAWWAEAEEQDEAKWLPAFVSLCIFSVAISLLRSYGTFKALVHASHKLHDKMLKRQAKAAKPIFFDQNPGGRILNRFSKDVSFMDDLLPLTVYDFIVCSFQVIGAVGLVCAINPWVVLALPLLLLAFYSLLKYYLNTSREVKRLESTTRSPVYSLLSETLAGLVTVRAFGEQKRFNQEMRQAIDENTKAWYSFIASSRWLGFRLDAIVVVLLLVATTFSVALKEYGNNPIDPGLLGAALTYLIQLGGLFQWAVRQAAEVENQIIAVERVLAYSRVDQEAALYSSPGHAPPSDWPPNGEVVATNLSCAYREDMPNILKGLTFRIKPGQRVGIVGRTGAGKSTLIACLFRLCEYDRSGGSSITVDGVSISDVGLHELRSRMSVLPQQAFLFSGTLRQNIDPFKRYSDGDMLHALEVVHMKDYVLQQEGGLDAMLAEAGSNLSAGQKQLLCLARVILQRNRVLVMDEATANIDLQTDRLIHHAIKDHCKDIGATTLIVAHRLKTVIDCDQVIVLGAGKVLESGHPHELLEQHPHGAFYDMVESTGSASAAELKALAKDLYESAS
ncbi:unnamed protein product [Chrysoparadoxa australica]